MVLYCHGYPIFAGQRRRGMMRRPHIFAPDLTHAPLTVWPPERDNAERGSRSQPGQHGFRHAAPAKQARGDRQAEKWLKAWTEAGRRIGEKVRGAFATISAGGYLPPALIHKCVRMRTGRLPAAACSRADRRGGTLPT